MRKYTYLMDDLEKQALLQAVQLHRYYTNEITLEQLRERLHILIDDTVVRDALITKNKMDKGV
jgi:hypothetical protein